MMQKDQLELAVVNDWALYDMTAVEHLVPRIEGLLQTDAAKARPDVCFALMLQSRQLPTWFAGDLTSMAPVVVDMALSLCSACETAPDFGMREFCAALLSFTSLVLDIGLLAPTFDWKIFGEDGQHCRVTYDYDKHHHKFFDVGNADYLLCMMGISLPLALHWGDLAAVAADFERAADAVPRMVAEPNQTPETITRFWLNGGIWPYLLGKGKQMAAIIGDCVGTTWAEIDQWCDAYTDDADNTEHGAFAPTLRPCLSSPVLY